MLSMLLKRPRCMHQAYQMKGNHKLKGPHGIAAGQDVASFFSPFAAASHAARPEVWAQGPVVIQHHPAGSFGDEEGQ